MVSFLLLPAMGSLLLLCAASVAWWRDHGLKTCLVEGAVSLAAAALPIGASVVAFAIGTSGGASVSRNIGGSLLVASPFMSALALRAFAGRALGRSMVGGLAAWTLAAVWLVLLLKGPGGGWTPVEVTVAAMSAAVATASGACAAAWSRRSRVGRRWRRARGDLAITLLVLAGCASEPGELDLRVVARDTGRETTARVELLATSGRAVIPETPLPIVGDCGMPPVHNWLPAAARLQTALQRKRSIWNPFTRTEQFYVDGALKIELEPGSYTLRAWKGPEHRVARSEVVVSAGSVAGARLELERWIDLPSEGWYSADDHLHIPRPSAGFDPWIARWMQSEDLHVANLLQMGLARDVHITPQRGFGEPSVYRRGQTLVVSGQENPRSHVLGHSIVLGAPSWIDFPLQYLRYPQFWREARRHGGVNGLAHFG